MLDVPLVWRGACSVSLTVDTDFALSGRSVLAPFIDLPEMYLDILRNVHDKTCSVCGKLPPDPAICLLCGTLVCMGNTSCRGQIFPDEGQCTSHARICGAGQCLFLIP